MDKKEVFEQLRNQGKTLEEIGKLHGVSRQRVYQILTTDAYGEKPAGGQIKSRQLRLGINIVRSTFIQKYYEGKEEALTHYGNGKCACVLCGYDDFRALSIDHIKGCGKEHRKHLGASDIYRWLIKNKFPPGYRTLCMNCQWVTKSQNQFVRKSQNNT